MNKIYVREWLNDTEGRAYIIIDGDDGEPDDKYYYSSVIVEIGDCNRSINLDFSFGTEEDRQKRIKKIRALKSYLTITEEFIENIKVPEKESK